MGPGCSGGDVERGKKGHGWLCACWLVKKTTCIKKKQTASSPRQTIIAELDQYGSYVLQIYITLKVI